ncbi:hypothetical protein DFJ73DRAFT_846932 [Zopfochytrium polystomum]|nr:hypothetical protein DFJ73DRAFT_846932 [Zopfochytrium polystomum]
MSYYRPPHTPHSSQTRSYFDPSASYNGRSVDPYFSQTLPSRYRSPFNQEHQPSARSLHSYDHVQYSQHHQPSGQREQQHHHYPQQSHHPQRQVHEAHSAGIDYRLATASTSTSSLPYHQVAPQLHQNQIYHQHPASHFPHHRAAYSAATTPPQPPVSYYNPHRHTHEQTQSAYSHYKQTSVVIEGAGDRTSDYSVYNDHSSRGRPDVLDRPSSSPYTDPPNGQTYMPTSHRSPDQSQKRGAFSTSTPKRAPARSYLIDSLLEPTERTYGKHQSESQPHADHSTRQSMPFHSEASTSVFVRPSYRNVISPVPAKTDAFVDKSPPSPNDSATQSSRLGDETFTYHPVAGPSVRWQFLSGQDSERTDSVGLNGSTRYVMDADSANDSSLLEKEKSLSAAERRSKMSEIISGDEYAHLSSLDRLSLYMQTKRKEKKERRRLQLSDGKRKSLSKKVGSVDSLAMAYTLASVERPDDLNSDVDSAFPNTERSHPESVTPAKKRRQKKGRQINAIEPADLPVSTSQAGLEDPSSCRKNEYPDSNGNLQNSEFPDAGSAVDGDSLHTTSNAERIDPAESSHRSLKKPKPNSKKRKVLAADDTGTPTVPTKKKSKTKDKLRKPDDSSNSADLVQNGTASTELPATPDGAFPNALQKIDGVERVGNGNLPSLNDPIPLAISTHHAPPPIVKGKRGRKSRQQMELLHSVSSIGGMGSLSSIDSLVVMPTRPPMRPPTPPPPPLPPLKGKNGIGDDLHPTIFAASTPIAGLEAIPPSAEDKDELDEDGVVVAVPTEWRRLSPTEALDLVSVVDFLAFYGSDLFGLEISGLSPVSLENALYSLPSTSLSILNLYKQLLIGLYPKSRYNRFSLAEVPAHMAHHFFASRSNPVRRLAVAFSSIDFPSIPPQVHAQALTACVRSIEASSAFHSLMDNMFDQIDSLRKDLVATNRKRVEVRLGIKPLEEEVAKMDASIEQIERALKEGRAGAEIGTSVPVDGHNALSNTAEPISTETSPNADHATPKSSGGSASSEIGALPIVEGSFKTNGATASDPQPSRAPTRRLLSIEMEKARKEAEKEMRAETARIYKERNKVAAQLEAAEDALEEVDSEERDLQEKVDYLQRKIRLTEARILGSDRYGALYMWIELGDSELLEVVEEAGKMAAPDAAVGTPSSVDQTLEQSGVKETDVLAGSSTPPRPQETLPSKSKSNSRNSSPGNRRSSGKGSPVAVPSDTRTSRVFGILIEYPETPTPLNGAEFNPNCLFASSYIPTEICPRWRYIASVQDLRSFMGSLNERGLRERELIIALREKLKPHHFEVPHPVHEKYAETSWQTDPFDGEDMLDKIFSCFGQWARGLGQILSDPQLVTNSLWACGAGFLPSAKFSIAIGPANASLGEKTSDDEARTAKENFESLEDETAQNADASFHDLVRVAVKTRLSTLAALTVRGAGISANRPTPPPLSEIDAIVTLEEALRVAEVLVASQFSEKVAKEIQDRLGDITTLSSLSLFLTDICREGTSIKGIKGWLLEDEGRWVVDEEASYERKSYKK